MVKKSLFLKLSAISLICIIIPMIIILIYATHSASNALENQAAEALTTIAFEKNDQVNLVFDLQFQISDAMVNEPTIVNFFETVARSGEIDDEKLAELSRYLEERFENANGLYENIFFSYHDRVLVDGIGGGSVGHQFDPVTEAYYFEQLDHPGVSPADYMYSPVTNRPVIPIANSVLDPVTNEVLSVFVIPVDINRLTEELVDKKTEDQVSTMILDAEGLVIASDQEEYVLNLRLSESDETKDFFEEMSRTEAGTGQFILDGVPQAVSYVKNEEYGLYILTFTSVEQFMGMAHSLRSAIILVTLFSLAVASIVIILVVRRTVKPISALTQSAQLIAQGDLRVEGLQIKSKDEVGQLANAFNAMLHQLKGMVQRIADVSHTISQQSEALSRSAHEGRLGAEQMAATMEQLSAGAEEQASSSSAISSLIEDLNQQIEQSNEDGQALAVTSQEVYQISNDGKAEMDRSVQLMVDMIHLVTDSVDKVKVLERRSEEISKLIVVIQEIAAQTNLLALNASIEAARAGEAGRGFAVVADEVRKLAEQVGQSVTEITGIIEGIQRETKTMVASLEAGFKKAEEGNKQILISRDSFESINQAVAGMIDRIQNVSGHLTQIASNADKVNQSASEIAAASEEASAGIEQSTATAQQQSASMQEIAANMESLATLAEELNEMVKQFRI